MTKEVRERTEPAVIAVTGASNYLGQGLIKRLLPDPRTRRIVALDIKKPDLEDPRCVYHRVDLTSPSAHEVVSRLFASEGVGMLVHLVFSYTLSRNRALRHELEAIGTMHLLDACSIAGVRRIVARSTTAIYGARPSNPSFIPETQEPYVAPRGSTVVDKVELERQLLQHARLRPDTRVAILRDCTSLGATSINYLSSILTARHSPRLWGYDPLMQFIHEEDLFRAYHEVVFSGAQGIYNIVGKGVTRYSEAVRLAGGRELLLPESALRAGAALFWNLGLYDIPPAFIRHLKYAWVADGAKAARELGFRPEYDCFQALEEARRTRRGRKTA
ncbi:MAG: NAD-dependent epimerase/dehydratase family protein [Myxococcales bacterium]|nr:MAG: NAD-dependent epimerase/dehydratase family protein [Myxococcales bacterium]